MRRVPLLAASLLVSLALVSITIPASAQTWLFDSAQTLSSTDTSWDNITFDPASNLLFIARRSDGLMAWNVKTREAHTIEDSKGANGLVLAPDVKRAYVAMIDGTMLTLDLATLKPIGRTDLETGDLDTGFYEPTQKRVYMLSGPRNDKTTWISIDAATSQVLGRTEFNAKVMDTPATDGRGAIFAPMRDRNLLQQLDAKNLSLQKTWKLGDCMQPVSVRWEQPIERLLIACRGDKPVFVVLNPVAGVVATVPIGRGVDGMVVDEERHLVVTANGADSTLSVIRSDGPDAWSLVETISSRPMASVLARDPVSNRLFSVTASFTIPAPDKDGKQPAVFYHPDSFSILTWRPGP